MKRRMTSAATGAVALCLTFAASREAIATTVASDNFDTSHVYWNGSEVNVSGTIWDGMQGTAFAEYANADDTNTGEVTIRKNSISNAGSSAPFDSAALYLEVTGDFDVQVEMLGVSSLDAIPFRTHSLAAWTADQTKAIHLDNILGTTNTRRFRDLVGDDDFADSGGGTDGWFRLARSGDQFEGYWGTDGTNWTLLDTIDTSGDPYGDSLRVGLATWNDSGSDFSARFDNFLLLTPMEIAISNVVVADTAGISFDTVAGLSLTYHLESTPDLVSTNYSDTGASVTGSGGPMTLFDPTGTSTSKNYRVVAEF